MIPSSRFLEERLVRTADLANARCVVELGPGTGGTTRALLEAMPSQSRLLTIELDPRFSELLEALGDPRLVAHTGSATDIGAILKEHALPAPDAVISGIPFSTMPKEIGQSIIRAVRDSLAPGGIFLAYQFRGHVGRLGASEMGAPHVQMEWLNIPPMRFYRWVKQ